MENEEIKRNVKLGAFVAGSVILFLGALFYLGREGNLFNRTFTVSAIFKNVEGLKEGDNVWLSGVKIGMVRRVEIISEGQVIVTLSLKDKQNKFIKKDAIAFVGSDGLVGNKIVIIRPGNARQAIIEDDTINSLSPTDTQELFNLAKEVGMNTRSITDDLKLISSRLNKGEGIFGELLRDGPVSKDLRQTIAALKATGDNANRVSIEAKKILTAINEGDGLVTKLITDKTYVETFENTLKNISRVGDNSKKMSEDLKAIISKMSDSNNAVGALLTDTLFAQKLKSTLDHAKSASVKLDENMEALQHSFPLRHYFKKKRKTEELDKQKDLHRE
jgi:phospholipid/cholesterol/gamma-HCH transport system substrate-binding protein